MSDSAFSSINGSRLGGLFFAARRLVDGLYPGLHPSLQRGAGLEFLDYRCYCPGDDPKDIDWKLFGRTDRLYRRQYQQWSQMHLHILVDRTASMAFPPVADSQDHPPNSSSQHQSQMTSSRLHEPSFLTSAHFSKFDYARLLAATIARLAVRQGDRVSTGLFTDRVTDYTPLGGSMEHLQQLCWMLESVLPTDSGLGDLASSVAHAQRLARRRGLFVIISDLLDDPALLIDALDRLRHHRSDAIVFQVLCREELDLVGPLFRGASLRLTDLESRQSLATVPKQIRHRYVQLITQHIETVRQVCRVRGVDHRLVATNSPIYEALAHCQTSQSTLLSGNSQPHDTSCVGQ